MIVCDGLLLSTFCRKTEKRRPMREEMDGRGVSSARVSILSMILSLESTFPYLNLTRQVNNYVCRQERGIYKENENTKGENKCTDAIN